MECIDPNIMNNERISNLINLFQETGKIEENRSDYTFDSH